MDTLFSRLVLLASVLALTGCATREDLGPAPATAIPTSTFKSASMRESIQAYNKEAVANNGNAPWSCPVESLASDNRCAGWYDNVFLGPVGYVLANSNGYSVTPEIVHYTRYKSSGGIFSLAGAFMPITGVQSFVGSMILSSRLDDSNSWGEDKDAFTIQRKIYQKNAAQLTSGKYLWVGRYYPLPLRPSNIWEQYLNASLNHLAILARGPDEKQVGWASFVVSGVPYKIDTGIWGSASAGHGLFTYQFVGPVPKHLPAIYPTTYYWLDQAWHDPKKAALVVPGPSKSEPFMVLAAMQYRVTNPAAILPWIKAHQAQLAGWTVVYHLDGKTWAWKNGSARPVPLPPIAS